MGVPQKKYINLHERDQYYQGNIYFYVEINTYIHNRNQYITWERTFIYEQRPCKSGNMPFQNQVCQIRSSYW